MGKGVIAMLNKVEMKQDVEFKSDDQQFKQRKSFVLNNNGGQVNDINQSNIIKYNDLEEVDEVNISDDQKIIDLNKYKERNSLFDDEEKEENLDELNKLVPAYKSRLSKDSPNQIRLGKALSIDSTRMKGVKNALENYYSLLASQSANQAKVNDDNQEEKNKEAQEPVELIASLQNIISTCNKYIANRWPISKEGRRRLREVKEIRENAIKELGKNAGHPGWGLFGEYLKFGFKAITSPVWVPAKYTGRYVKRIGKRVGRLVYKKARGFANDMATYFGSWKAALTTIGLGVATLIGGTVLNALNSVLAVGGIALNAICSIVTVPRYLYHLAKGDVRLDALSTQTTGRYRAFAVPIPKPHLYSTWFKYIVEGYDPLFQLYHDHSAEYLHSKGDKQKEDDGRNLEISYIYKKSTGPKRMGKHMEYFAFKYGEFLGPIMDPYYHSTTLKFKKLIDFFRYSDKNDFDKVDMRQRKEASFEIDENDEDDPIVE